MDVAAVIIYGLAKMAIGERRVMSVTDAHREYNDVGLVVLREATRSEYEAQCAELCSHLPNNGIVDESGLEIAYFYDVAMD